ncbi:primosomal protein N', partial [Vibrio parahaemolyticus]|nr:primosomal protein N' [Vibrio parahaemolyticus]
VLEKGKPALVLVPEIGLTPPTINRFNRSFNVPVDVIHSGLNETELLNAWLSESYKAPGIIIVTRSALLAPFSDLGIINV